MNRTLNRRVSKLSKLRSLFFGCSIAPADRRRRGLVVEQLESRRLMAVTLGNIPSWAEQGPGPINNGQTTGITNNPVVGSLQAIASDPGNANNVFVGGSNGGIWRTTNALNANPTWTPLTDAFQSLSVGGIGMNPANANEVIVAMGNRASGNFDALGAAGGDLIGALYTTNALAPNPTWKVLSNNINTSNNQAAAARNGYLLVAGTGGVYRSTNGGTTFTLLSGTGSLPAGAVLDMFGDPGNANRFYVAGTFGVFRCDDASVANPTWTNVTNPAMSISGATNNIRIGIHDNGGTNIVYVGIVNGGQLAAVTWSSNQGGAWTAMDVPGVLIGGNTVGIQPEEEEEEDEEEDDEEEDVSGSQGRIHFSLVADPNNANFVYVGGDRQQGTGPNNSTFPNPIGANTFTANLFRGDRSQAQGASADPALSSNQWTPITDNYAGGGSAPHADSRRMVFDANGNLLESDDGGLYRRSSPTTNGGAWTSVNGNLRVSEFWTVSYDTVNGIVFGGTQDTGTEEQSASNSFTYNTISAGDGFFSAADNTSVANQSVRYTMGNTFTSFNRRVFDNSNSQVGGTTVVQLAAAATPGTARSGLNTTDQNANAALNVFVLNATDPRLMMVGATGVYEDNDSAGNAGDIIADVTPAAMTGFVRALAYGGRRGGTAFAQIAYVGTQSGELFVRGETGGFVARNTGGAGQVSDIAVDPDDWMTAYVLQGNSVFVTSDGGANFTNITDNLGLLSSQLRSLSLWDPAAGTTDGTEIVLAGGRGGVYRNIPTSGPGTTWSEYGAGMPNTITEDIQVYGDFLLAGTYGRGALSITNVSATIASASVLEVCGDEDSINQDDTFRLVRDPNNPALLQVFVNNVLEFTGAMAAVGQINVFAAGGNDDLIVDSSNGLISVPSGIRYDGDHACPMPTGLFEDPPLAGIGGFDRLDLVQTGGPTITLDQLSPGSTVGEGRSFITDNTGNAQRVDFQYLEPVVDTVPSPNFMISALPGLASVLQASNAINYSAALLIPPPAATIGARVTIDAFEPIEFANKVAVTIDAGSGNDIVNLNNAATPTGLTSITVNGNDGDDQLTARSGTPVPVTMNGGAGNDLLDAAGASGGPGTLAGGDGNDVIIGGAGANTYDGGAGDDLLVVSAGADVMTGGDGFDVIQYAGNDANNTLGLNQAGSTITVSGFVTGTIDVTGGGIERIDVLGKAGADTINLTALAIATVADGGTGNDNVDGTGMTSGFTALGGDGDDTLTGGSGGDRLEGGTGLDVINGNGGANTILGGDDADLIFSESDASNTIDGGGGQDVFSYSDTVAPFTVSRNSLVQGALSITSPGQVATVFDVEEINILPPFNDPTAAITVRDLTGTDLRVLAISRFDRGPSTTTNNFGGTIEVDGTGVADSIVVANTDFFVNDPAVFLPWGRVVIDDLVPGFTSLTINGLAGDDSITIDPSANLGATPVTLNGDDGDDLIRGGLNADTLNGGAGEDTLIGRGGADTYDGGTEYDTILIQGTSANDVMDVSQTAAGTLVYTVNGTTETDTIILVAGIPSVEQALIVGGQGDDLVRVSVADALEATPAASLRFNVDGGAPNASDRLLVNDDGIGDLTILRQGSDERSGSVTVGALSPVVYQNIERMDVIPLDPVTGGTGTGGGGRIKVFHNDPFEFNESRLNSAQLQRVGESPTSPTIDPGAITTPFAVNGDEDWYEFRPQATGTFQVKILFDTLATVPSGRPGLPGAGDLSLDIYDANGVLIVSGVPAPGGKAAIFAATNDSAFPQFNRIFVRVHGATAPSINLYEFDNIAGLGTGNPGVTNVDVFGPQVTDVSINHIPTSTYNLFGQKPGNASQGPTPRTDSLVIQFQDRPNRAPGFLYPALDYTLTADQARGLFEVKGDATGIAVIDRVVITQTPAVLGQVPTSTIEIFFPTPLLDDRFTLTVDDSLRDPANNRLDGESNADEPNGAPKWPSGDGKAGGNFVSRFTIDSRPEIANYSAGSAFVDINQNYIIDPQGNAADISNRDLTFQIGTVSDALFSGRFEPASAALNDNDRYDKLGAYGYDNAAKKYRFLLDFNFDGISDLRVVSNFQVNGTPVAGNFVPGRNGDEIGLFDGQNWYLDNVGDNQLHQKIVSNMRGQPIVGDFNGDGRDDLATYDAKTNTFFFDTNRDGQTDDTLVFTGPLNGVTESPVAGDLNLDGIDDLGLRVSNRQGTPTPNIAEWYFVLSDRTGQLLPHNVFDVYAPSPLGNDLFAQFGDYFSLPLFGNFDPPVGAQPSDDQWNTNVLNRLDVDNNGVVSPLDAMEIINQLNRHTQPTRPANGTLQASYLDVDGNGVVAPFDAMEIINELNSRRRRKTDEASSDGEGEGSLADAALPTSYSNGGPTIDDNLLSLLAADSSPNKKRS